jgi:hypothetical protein
MYIFSHLEDVCMLGDLVHVLINVLLSEHYYESTFTVRKSNEHEIMVDFFILFLYETFFVHVFILLLVPSSNSMSHWKAFPSTEQQKGNSQKIQRDFL